MEYGSRVTGKDYLGMPPVKELQAALKYQWREGCKEYGCVKDQADGNIHK